MAENELAVVLDDAARDETVSMFDVSAQMTTVATGSMIGATLT